MPAGSKREAVPGTWLNTTVALMRIVIRIVVRRHALSLLYLNAWTPVTTWLGFGLVSELRLKSSSDAQDGKTPQVEYTPLPRDMPGTEEPG